MGYEAAVFAELYRPLLGLWAAGGCPAATEQLLHVADTLAAVADAVCQDGRMHPLLGNTLVRVMPFVPDVY